MPTRALLKRIEKIKQSEKERSEAQSKYSEDCLCFPDYDPPPLFVSPIEEAVASLVKCPLHGHRWKATFRRLYLPEWYRERLKRRRETLSPQYRKALAASFPPELWPPEREVTAEGVYWCLKDGTRFFEGDATQDQGPQQQMSELSGGRKKFPLTRQQARKQRLDRKR